MFAFEIDLKGNILNNFFMYAMLGISYVAKLNGISCWEKKNMVDGKMDMRYRLE